MVNNVVLTGDHKGQPVVAEWQREHGGWSVVCKFGDKTATEKIQGREMPCWTVTVKMIERKWLSKLNMTRKEMRAFSAKRATCKHRGLKLVR